MRKIVIGSLIAVLSLTPSQVALAHSQEVNSDKKSLLNIVDRTVEDTLERTTDVIEGATDKSKLIMAAETLKERVKSQQQQVEERKTELRNEMKNRQQNRKEKLEGRRLAQCQNRQEKINLLLDKSAQVGSDRLAHIQRVEEAVKTFYTNQTLSSDSYDAAVDVIDQKEAAAIAVLDVSATQKFECNELDGANPSSIIKSTHEAKRLALNEYKTAVKDLISVVKAALAEKKSASEVNQ